MIINQSSAWGASSVGNVYSSLAHAPRSINLQRSEQNGRNSFASQVEGSPQRGHGNDLGIVAS